MFGAQPPQAHGLPVACLCLPLPPLVPVSAENQDQMWFLFKNKMTATTTHKKRKINKCRMKCEKKLNKGNAVKVTGIGGAWTCGRSAPELRCPPLQAQPGALVHGQPVALTCLFAGTRPTLLAVGTVGCHLGGCGRGLSAAVPSASFPSSTPSPEGGCGLLPCRAPCPGVDGQCGGQATPGRTPGEALRAQAGSALLPPPPGAKSAGG